MESWVQTQLAALLLLFGLPHVGLGALLVLSFVSATLLPLASEPAVYALVRLHPELFWPAVLVATVGNTAGGALTWWMGLGAERAYEQVAHRPAARATGWLRRFGAPACLLSWLPVVGDPLCAAAGWLQLPFWPCLAYMAVGKFLRYLAMTAGLVWLFPGAVAVAVAA